MLKSKFLSQEVPFVSQISLLLSNLIPLIGVLFLDWQVTTLLAIYWAESGIIGFYTVLKMAKSQKISNKEILKKFKDKLKKKDKVSKQKVKKFKQKLKNKVSNYQKITKLFLIIFFIFHFGGFMFGHGIFLLVFFSKFGNFQSVNLSGIFLTVLGLFISHGISYYKNYIAGEEYKQYSPKELMGMPYSRIILMHLVIIFSAFLTVIVGSHKVAALLLMIGLKIVFDLKSHIEEHKNSKESA